jgi:succinoglycan biosynthesis transport protein ExoP
LDTPEKNNGNTSGKRKKSNSDPVIQAKDESGNRADGTRPKKNSQKSNELVPAANVTVVPNRFISLQKPEKTTQSANNILESMFRFKWTFLLVAIMFSAPLVAGIWTLIVPKYQAKAEIQVRPFIPYLVFRTEDSGMIPLYNSFLNTQVSIIRSLTVLQRVLDQQDIQQTQWYRNPDASRIKLLHKTEATPMERLLDSLYVRPRSGTWIIDVFFVDARPEEAKLIVNSVLDQYIDYIKVMSDATEDELYRQLADQYKVLENEILGRGKTVAELYRKLGTETPNDLISAKRVRLDEAEANLSILQQRIEVLEWRLKQFDISDGNDAFIAFGGEVQPEYYEDAEWRKLDINMKTLQHEIENSIYTDKNPEMVRAKKDLEFAQELLELRESQIDKERRKLAGNIVELPSIADANYATSKEGTEFQLEQLKHEEHLRLEEVNKKRVEFESLFENAQLLARENNELQHKRELFDAVRQRLDQKNMERNVPGSINILMGAFASSRPYNDKRPVFTAMVLALGICLGGGAAFLRAGKNQVVYTPQDISRQIQLPLIGYIPLINLKRSLGKALSDEIKRKQFMLKESIRFMRTVLLSHLDNRDSAAILITSSVTGTGKSSFTNTLGYSLAQAGKSVLIIDTDFHKMSLSESYDLVGKPGFIDYLNAGSTEIPYIYSTNTAGLSIIPAGEHRNNRIAFEDIAKSSFRRCMEQLRKRYQIILLDSSPILPLADASIISSKVDGTILVERELISHRRDIASALARLSSAGGKPFGFVFVGSIDNHNHKYESYYYTSNLS